MFDPLLCFAEDRSREVVIDCFYSVGYLFGFFAILSMVFTIWVWFNSGERRKQLQEIEK